MSMSMSMTTIIATIINFIIIVLVLKHFFWGKIKAAIEERENFIEDKVNKADEDAEKARKLRLDNERLMKSVKHDGKKLAEEQKKKADKVYQEIVDEAHKEADAIIARAKLEISREKGKAEYEIKEQTVELALMLSAKALEESIDESKHRDLINDFITKVGI